MLKNTFFGYAKPKKCIYGILMSYIYPIPPTFFVKYKGKIRKNKEFPHFFCEIQGKNKKKQENTIFP